MCNYTIAIVGILLLANYASSAQQLLNPRRDTVRWEYGIVENRVKSETVPHAGHFISYGDNSFLWVQNGVDRKYLFKTRSLKGDWNDAKKNGQLVYRVTCNGEEGTLKLVRTRQRLIVELDFLQPSKTTPHLVLLITSIQKI